MERLEHKSFIYEWLEHTYHHEVLPDHVIMAFFVAAVLAAFALWFKSKISVDNPGKLQLLLEAMVGALKDMLLDNVGTKGRPFLGLIGTLGLFILACNWIGLVPYFASPTVSLNFTLGLWFKSKISVDNPGKLQLLLEAMVGALRHPCV